jgi:hypothetical protein
MGKRTLEEHFKKVLYRTRLAGPRDRNGLNNSLRYVHADRLQAAH